VCLSLASDGPGYVGVGLTSSEPAMWAADWCHMALITWAYSLTRYMGLQPDSLPGL
jgi:hypothetical protein